MYSFVGRHKLPVLLLVLLVLLVLNLSSQGIRDAFAFAFSPLQSFLWRGGTQASIFLSGSSPLELELSEENLVLKEQLLSLKETEKENARLREAFGTFIPQELDLLLVEVIGKEISRDALLVNKGAVDGVREGMGVVTQSKVAVGSIEKVSEHTATIALLSLKDRSFNVKVQGREVIGILRGKGGYEAVLDLIPQEEDLLSGDVLLTSALSGIFPDNLLVGELQNVEKSDLMAFQGGKVELFFHPKKENSLFVIQ